MDHTRQEYEGTPPVTLYEVLTYVYLRTCELREIGIAEPTWPVLMLSTSTGYRFSGKLDYRYLYDVVNSIPKYSSRNWTRTLNPLLRAYFEYTS